MLSLITKRTTRGSDRKLAQRSAPRRGYRPALEGLEGRIVLSSVPTPIGSSSTPPPPTQSTSL